MKEYIIFIYDQYYPLGGFNDYLNNFDTFEECKEYMIDFYKNYEYNSVGYFQIVNTEKLQKIEYYFGNNILYLEDEELKEIE